MDPSSSMSSAHDSSEDDRRAAKLAAAKRRLKSFRATKSSVQAPIPTSPSRSISRHGSSGPAAGPSSVARHPSSPNKQHSRRHSHHRSISGGPLEPSHAANIILFPDEHAGSSPKHERNGSKGKGKAVFVADDEQSAAMGPETLMGTAAVSPKRGHAHRRSQSRAGPGHSRARSSISIAPGGLSRRSIIGVFDIEAEGDGEGDGAGAFAFNPFPDATRLSGPFLYPPAATAEGVNMPEEIITTPATPQVDPPDLADPFFSPREAGSDLLEDRSAVKARLSTFSFGSKPPQPGLRSPALPVEPASRDLLASPGGRRRLGGSSSPIASPRSAGRVSIPLALLDDSEHRSTTTPTSRPPSVILTQATPLHFSPTRQRPTSSLMPSGVTGDDDDPPLASSPATPARKRHSHTRSNSISLPNLKLGGGPRPVSLGVPNSPSFPASPGSPGSSSSDARSRLSSPLSGTRLKFEPSGRGAEAEQEKEEYRRKALDKLNGGSGSTVTPARSPLLSFFEEATSEIALPDLDDDETSSTTSSIRPLSGIFTSSTFQSARPHPLPLGPSSAFATVPSGSSSPASPFWANHSPHPDAPSPSFSSGALGDRWMPFGSGSSSPADQGLGFGMDLAVPRRGSLTRGIDVMAVVEEKADAEAEAEADAEAEVEAEAGFDTGAEGADEAGDDDEEDTDEAEADSFSQGVIPIAVPSDPQEGAGSPFAHPATTGGNGLRQLQLLASTSGTPVDTIRQRAPPTASSSGSPTKGYGAIGKGRPQPSSRPTSKSFQALQSNESPASAVPSPPLTTSRSTSSLASRARAPSVGSRGSSISYRRHDTTSQGSEGSSVSSSRWSSSAKLSSSIASPPSLDHPLSASLSFRPESEVGVAQQHSRWDSRDQPSGTTRPCPRPQSLIGLGLSAAGSRRILSEVHESDEDESNDSLGLASVVRPAGVYRDGRRKSADLPLSVRDSHDSTAGSLPWQDHHLELELERDALREDVEMWRIRCKGLEDKLEAERRGSGVLRERVRKLSDRLLSASTAPPPTMNIALPDAQAAAEMRQQLFQLTAALERERRDKEQALAQLADIQQRLDSTPRLSAPASPPSRWPVSPAPPLPLPCPSPIITPATPIASSHPSPVVTPKSHPEPAVDPNTHRMKAWGFPRASATANKDPSPTKRKDKRDSFFGLSKMPQMPSGQDDGELTPQGLDLPPFVFPSHGAPTGIRVVSEPKTTVILPPVPPERRRSISNPSPRPVQHDGHPSSGPFGFLSSYLGVSPPQGDFGSGLGHPAVLVVDDGPPRPVDMRGSCADCRGDLIEV